MSIKGKQQKPNQTAYVCQPNKPFSECNQTTPSHLNYIFPLFSPHNRRGGEKYCFGADPVGVGVLVVHCLHSVSWTNWWSLTKLAQTHYWEGGKKWLDFGDTDLIFKVIPVSQFILPPGQLAPRGASQPQLVCPPGGQAVPGYLTPRPGYLHPGGASCPGRFILPPAHAEKILLCDVYYYLQHFNNYMQFLSYKYVNLRLLLQTFSWVSYWQGVGGKLSRAVYLAPRPEFQREWIISNFYYIIYFRNI